ncbi:malectin-B-like [Saccoglossus kowalevskii]|uniref:Malectin-B-like n=1 Tax=Saccoglossus kowalevskii TaxID=10224 RepID=A0ABM0GIB5_SACKO|nr:PREDICTED: malectin-B-like [Saccoglossus kowalevskii]
MKLLLHIIFSILFILGVAVICDALGEVIWGVNSGGEEHIDSYGIHYQADPLQGIQGIASDFGKSLHISRVPQQDQLLYQTERYDLDSFGYEIPIEEDGDYVLVMKFSEVYFTASNQKVFDIVINEQHTVVPELDIYDKVGRGTAHDEMVPFTITRGKLKVNGEVSTFSGTLNVEFLKGYRDNPKINAMYLMKGTMNDVPKLPPIPGLDLDEEEPEEDLEEDKPMKPKAGRKTSGPKTVDPYAADESSMMFPIVIAIGVFIPTLFCLCRL